MIRAAPHSVISLKFEQKATVAGQPQDTLNERMGYFIAALGGVEHHCEEGYVAR